MKIASRGQSRGECKCRSPTAKAWDAYHMFPAGLQARIGLAGLMNLTRKELVIKRLALDLWGVIRATYFSLAKPTAEDCVTC